MNEEIPDYEDAKLAIYYGNDEILEAALFAFQSEDSYYVGRVTQAVQNLLRREEITPRQIVGIGRALLGLGRLPLRTPGLDVQISLSYKIGDGCQGYDLFISADRFATESGGYDNFGFGTDSFSGTTFSVEPGCREYEGFLIETENWPDQFIEMLKNDLKVVDCSIQDLLDWDHPDGEVFWDWINDHD